MYNSSSLNENSQRGNICEDSKVWQNTFDTYLYSIIGVSYKGRKTYLVLAD